MPLAGSKVEIPKPMTFRPTMEEFSNLQEYMASVEAQGGHIAGICKIVTPPEYKPRKQGYDPDSFPFTIERPLKQTYTPLQGMKHSFSTSCEPKQGLSVADYKELSLNPLFATPPHDSYEHLEEIYWKQLEENNTCPLYAADVNDSLMDDDLHVWNFQSLQTILTEGMEEVGLEVKGVNTPYLYFGMWRTTFSWHVEDMDLYGVNYHHYGAPKTWYCIPPKSGHKIDKLACDLFPEQALYCTNFLRHKTVMIGPQELRRRGVEVSKMVQEPGDIIVVFPHAYHAGFNHGFNINEATNIALPRWVEYGKRYRGCDCSDAKTSVNLDMSYFVKRFQPDRYEKWVKDEDIGPHPSDSTPVKKFFQTALSSEDPDVFLAMMDQSSIPVEFKFTYYKSKAAGNKAGNNPDPPSDDSIEDQESDEDWEPQPKKAKKQKPSNGRGQKERRVSRGSRTEESDCKGSHRYMPCGECVGCVRPNCGKCGNCRDMPRYGGKGISKEKCLDRTCRDRIKVACDYCAW